MDLHQDKRNITIRELCTDISNFFEVTPIHIFTNSLLEKRLDTHKKTAGRNIVLLVSNGVEEAQTNITPSRVNNSIRILNHYNLNDSHVVKLGHDRSQLIYNDVVNFINRKTNQELPPHSQATLLSHTNYPSDQAILEQIQNVIRNKKEPQFVTAFLSSTFLTQTGTLNQNALPISNLIENLNGSGTLYLLTSTHELAQKTKEASSNTFKTHIQPIVPLLVAAELLRHSKNHKISVQEPIDWRRNHKDKIDFSCLARIYHGHNR
ncbi:MAG: hypothetical protein IJY92_02975 [Alphaproteobacteria bacterium]|nr:hypothetical protein [Alphaproteobacteria bacterium]